MLSKHLVICGTVCHLFSVSVLIIPSIVLSLPPPSLTGSPACPKLINVYVTPLMHSSDN